MQRKEYDDLDGKMKLQSEALAAKCQEISSLSSKTSSEIASLVGAWILSFLSINV